MPRIEINVHDCHRVNSKLVASLERICSNHRYKLTAWDYDAEEDIAYIRYSTKTDALEKYKKQFGHYPIE